LSFAAFLIVDQLRIFRVQAVSLESLTKCSVPVYLFRASESSVLIAQCNVSKS
jgi:hypothetical protein